MTRRFWFKRDANFTADPKIAAVGDALGTAGPFVLEEVLALAKLAEEAGRVTTTYGILARRAFCTPSKAKAAVLKGVEVGFLRMVEQDPKGCTVEVVAWSDWNAKADLTAAERKRRQREKEAQQRSNVTPLSRVTLDREAS